LYENNYKIICHTKTTIVLWKTIELNFAFAKEKKLAWYLYDKKWLIKNYHINDVKNIVYDMKLK